MVRTYLDEVPWGDDEFLRQEEEKTRKERKKLPVGCQDSTLYKDIMRIAWQIGRASCRERVWYLV